MLLIPRPALEERISASLRTSPVTLLLGPRQCGKTTLARKFAAKRGAAYFDLEDPETELRPESAALTLRGLRGLVVIDECQREPALFPLLRVLADRKPGPARFLLLGSASPELVRGASESLAGRVRHVDMSGFGLEEAGPEHLDPLWLRGGFPRSFKAPSDAESFRWRLEFVRTHLERDLPQLGLRIPAPALRRFWGMLAHVHGQHWNASELARSMGTQEDTARRYLDVLTGSFMMRQLQPWFENTGKRLVKAPKVYFRDSGLLHALLGIRTRRDLGRHPKLGFSWEGFALEQVIRLAGAEHESFFYGTHGGAELDLLIVRGSRRFGFEFKFADAPQPTRSMHEVIKDLSLDHLWAIYPGSRVIPLRERITALPLTQLERVIHPRTGRIR
ncbi:MAG: ATP-binding protein [Elusimicrobia bacterium]|nr:ATP-binding protein [Elusimicrobiota bacterium]